jgi:GNAT superfamily N-acetyltransferase
MKVHLRVAQKQDCWRLMELINELAVTLQQFEEAGFGPRPIWKAFVAEVDGFIVGFALYYVRYSTWKGSRLYLEDLIVTEIMRGKGIGKLLFNRLIQEASEMGFNGMSWQVLDWNEPAIKFYKKYEAGLDAGWLNASLTTQQILNYKP